MEMLLKHRIPFNLQVFTVNNNFSFKRVALVVTLLILSNLLFSQQSRFGFETSIIGMRVTPNLQGNFVRNDWVWTDPVSGNQYLEYKANEPRGVKIGLSYQLTKRLFFTFSEEVYNRTYHMRFGTFNEEKQKYEITSFLNRWGMEEKFLKAKLLSASTQFGLSWRESISEKIKLVVYSSINYDFYEFNQAIRDLPTSFRFGQEILKNDEQLQSVVTGTASVVTLNSTSRGVSNNFWSWSYGLKWYYSLTSGMNLFLDMGFRNTALWREYAFDKNSVNLNIRYAEYTISDVYLENATYEINRNFDFPLYLGGFYGGMGVSVQLFETIDVEKESSGLKKIFAHLIQRNNE